jgi:hypothetical protein
MPEGGTVQSNRKRGYPSFLTFLLFVVNATLRYIILKSFNVTCFLTALKGGGGGLTCVSFFYLFFKNVIALEWY